MNGGRNWQIIECWKYFLTEGHQLMKYEQGCINFSIVIRERQKNTEG